MSVYEIGMEITLANGASKGLAVIAADLLGIKRLQGEVEKGFASFHKALMIGGAASIALGVETLKVMGHIEEHGEKLAHVQNQLENQLPKASAAMDMAIAKTAAYSEAGRNMNSTFEGNIETLKDLYKVFQDMPESARLLPAFNNLSNVMSFVKPEKGKNDKVLDRKNIAAAARAFDLVTGGDAEQSAMLADKYRKTVSALGDNASGMRLLAVVKGAGAAAQGWDVDKNGQSFVASNLMEWANGGMGTSAGNTLAMMYKNIYAGRTSNMDMAAAMERMGIQKHENRLIDPDTGKAKRDFVTGSAFEAEVFRHDPTKWMNDFRDKLSRDGIDVVGKNGKAHHVAVNIQDAEQMAKAIADAWGAQKSQWKGFDEGLLPNGNRMLNRGAQNIAGAGDATDRLREKDAQVWRDRVSKKWEDLQASVGLTLVEPMIDKVLKPLAETLRDMSQYAIKNPEKVEKIAKTIVGIGAGLVALGAIAVSSALLAMLGPAGWLVAGLTTIASVSKGMGLDNKETAAATAVGGVGLVALYKGFGALFGKDAPNVAATSANTLATDANTAALLKAGGINPLKGLPNAANDNLLKKAPLVAPTTLGVLPTIGAATPPVLLGLGAGALASGALYGIMSGLVKVGAVQPTGEKGLAGYQHAHQAEMDRLAAQQEKDRAVAKAKAAAAIVIPQAKKDGADAAKAASDGWFSKGWGDVGARAAESLMSAFKSAVGAAASGMKVVLPSPPPAKQAVLQGNVYLDKGAIVGKVASAMGNHVANPTNPGRSDGQGYFSSPAYATG
jgi:hypothetical protein